MSVFFVFYFYVRIFFEMLFWCANVYLQKRSYVCYSVIANVNAHKARVKLCISSMGAIVRYRKLLEWNEFLVRFLLKYNFPHDVFKWYSIWFTNRECARRIRMRVWRSEWWLLRFATVCNRITPNRINTRNHIRCLLTWNNWDSNQFHILATNSKQQHVSKIHMNGSNGHKAEAAVECRKKTHRERITACKRSFSRRSLCKCGSITSHVR